MKKSSIVSFHFADNFGAVLQIYGLQKQLTDLGQEVQIINFAPIALEEPYTTTLKLGYTLKNDTLFRTLKKIVKKMLEFKRNYYRRRKFNKFRESYLNITAKKITDPNELSTSLPKFDNYFVGSDQVWNPIFFKYADTAYFLKFAPKESKKISYAASIAQDFSPEYEEIFKSELPQFTKVSVREKSGKDRLKQFLDLPIETALDPTLLLSKDEWLPLASEDLTFEPFILVYDLQISDTIIEFTNRLSEETDLKVVSYSDANLYKNQISSFSKLGPSEFLKLYNDAEFVVTSSFHGTAFSIIFEKEFYTVPHSIRGSRMIDLLNDLNLENRIVNSLDYRINLTEKTNYEIPRQKLKVLQKDSLEFLKSALEEK